MKIICCFLTALLIAPTVYCHSPDCSGTQQLYHAVGSVLHWSGVVAGALELAVVELELEDLQKDWGFISGTGETQ